MGNEGVFGGIVMNQPLFKVGEEVILQSSQLPECNGEYVVSGIERVCGCWYDLGFTLPEDIEHGGTLWAERCLKKKYKPSTQSYDELVKELQEFEV